MAEEEHQQLKGVPAATVANCGMDMAEQGKQQTSEKPAGAVANWVKQLQSSDPEEQAAAAYELGRLSCDSASNRALIVDAGAAPLLVAMLSTDNTRSQGFAAKVLRSLASDSCTPVQGAAADAIPALVRLLQNGGQTVQPTAALAVYNLANNNDKNKAAIITAKAIPLLELLCDSRNSRESQWAGALSLYTLVEGNSNLESHLSKQILPTLVRLTNTPMDKRPAEGKETPDTTSGRRTDSSSCSADKADGRECFFHISAHEAQLVAGRLLLRMLHGSRQQGTAMLSKQVAAGVPATAVAMLKAESEQVQLTAALMLFEMLRQNDGVTPIYQEAGAIPALIGLLGSGTAHIEAAARALFQLIASHQPSKAAFVAAGGLNALVKAMSNTDQQLFALWLLHQLTIGYTATIQSAAVSSGILNALVQLLHSADRDTAIHAMMSLSELVEKNNSNQAAAAAAGAIPVLVTILKENNDMKHAALASLLNLARRNDSNLTAVAAADVVQAVVAALHDDASEPLHLAAELLGLLVGAQASCQSAAIAAGAIPALASVLKRGDVRAQAIAAGALTNLAHRPSQLDVTADMANLIIQSSSTEVVPSHKGAWHAAAEAVPVLVQLLKHDNVCVQLTVATALANMLGRSSAIKDAFNAANGFAAVRSVISTSHNPTLQLLAGMLLDNLTRVDTYGNLG